MFNCNVLVFTYFRRNEGKNSQSRKISGKGRGKCLRKMEIKTFRIFYWVFQICKKLFLIFQFLRYSYVGNESPERRYHLIPSRIVQFSRNTQHGTLHFKTLSMKTGKYATFCVLTSHCSLKSEVLFERQYYFNMDCLKLYLKYHCSLSFQKA